MENDGAESEDVISETLQAAGQWCQLAASSTYSPSLLSPPLLSVFFPLPTASQGTLRQERV